MKTFWLKISGIVVVGMLIVVTLTGCKRKSVSSEIKPQTIHEAAKIGDIAAVEEFLGQGVRIDAKDEIGRTPLQLAARQGNTVVVELLLGKGASIHVKCRVGGMTALHHAAACGQKEVVELLIAKGADVNAKSKYGGTPLFSATMGRGDCKEVAELLITNGANVNTRDVYGGRTPLHLAVLNGQPEILELLLSEGANINAKDDDGETPLERAIILSKTKFRRGSLQAKRKKGFEACAEILREHEAK